MNIEKFRNDLKAAVLASGKSVLALSISCGVQQASLSRFLAGKSSLSAKTLFKLYPFVYPNGGPHAPKA